MKHDTWKKLVLGAALVAGLGLAAPALSAHPDAWVTAKVKLALFTAEGVSSNDINVDTLDGRVSLHGTVSSEAEKARAEKAAREIDGVREVRNMLAVVPAGKQEAVAAKDEDIETRAEDALEADRSLSDSDIDIASVNGGIVVLSGTAATLSDHVRAVEIVRGVKGVRQVKSQVKSPDALSDAEIWRDPGDAGTAAAVGGTASDMWVTTASKVRLIANNETPAMQINVDTRNGEVTLFGMVGSEAAKSAAEAEVRKVSGVKTVRNLLQVVPDAAQNAVARNDAEIRDQVEDKVDADQIADADLDVEVKDGVVRLKGTVDSQTDRLRALTLARSTDGVKSVVDEIRVAAN